MRYGYFVVFCIILYAVLHIIEAQFFFQYRFNIVLSIVIIVFSIIWLTENLNEWRKFFLSGNSHFTFEDGVRNGMFQIGFTSIAVIGIIFYESTKLIIANTAAYEFITTEIKKQIVLSNQIGELEGIFITKGFKASSKRIALTLIIFGDEGQLKTKVTALKNNQNWEINNLKMISE